MRMRRMCERVRAMRLALLPTPLLLFLADERIVTLLPKLLGTKFYEAKKQPVVVDISKKEKTKQNIEKALSSTFYLPNRGTNR